MLLLIANRSVRRLWLTGALTGTVRWLDALASGIYVLHLTGSGTWVAVSFLLRLVPMILLGALIGPLTTKARPVTILLASSCALAGTYGWLAVLAWVAGVSLETVLIAGFISGCYQAIEIPVRRTLLAEVAGSQRIGAAITLELSTSHVTRMAGPLLGGIYYEMLGMSAVYLIGVLGTAMSALLIWLYSRDRATKEGLEEPEALQLSRTFELSSGLRHIQGSQIVQAVLSCTIIVNLFGVCYLAVIPVLGSESLALSSTEIGMLQSAEGAGAFLGALMLGAYGRARHYNLFFYFGSLLYIIGILSLAFSQNGPTAISVIFLGGIGAAGFSTMQTTLLLHHTPMHIRHHLMGILQLCIGSGLLGLLLVGLLVDLFSPRAAVALTSSTGFLLLAYAALRWPVLWRVQP